jgi:hypothetical protein
LDTELAVTLVLGFATLLLALVGLAIKLIELDRKSSVQRPALQRPAHADEAGYVSLAVTSKGLTRGRRLLNMPCYGA